MRLIDSMIDNNCNVYMWPGEEGVDTRCGSPRPCPSHEFKKYAILKYPQHIMHIMCPKCGVSKGPGGMWLLNGELSYGNGRWPCKCGYEIPGTLFKKDLESGVGEK